MVIYRNQVWKSRLRSGRFSSSVLFSSGTEAPLNGVIVGTGVLLCSPLAGTASKSGDRMRRGGDQKTGREKSIVVRGSGHSMMTGSQHGGTEASWVEGGAGLNRLGARFRLIPIKRKMI